MKGAARKALDAAGGAQLAGGQDSVFVEGRLLVVKGDPVTPHGDGPHAGPVMASASSSVFAGGDAACRRGDAASCGHLSSGSQSVFIGD